jgi:hypothetical protein
MVRPIPVGVGGLLPGVFASRGSTMARRRWAIRGHSCRHGADLGRWMVMYRRAGSS